MNIWTALWISLLIIIPVAFVVVFIYFLLFHVFELDMCNCFNFNPRHYQRPPSSSIYLSSSQIGHKSGILKSDKLHGSWISGFHHTSHPQLNSPISNAFQSFNTPSPIHSKSNNNNNSFKSVHGYPGPHPHQQLHQVHQFNNSCSNFISLMNANKSSTSIIPGSVSNISSASLASLHNSCSSSSSPALAVTPLSVNRYIMCSSEEDAKSRALKAGGGNEPIFHSANKSEGTSYPHFHPNLPNANSCCVNYFYQFKKNSKSTK